MSIYLDCLRNIAYSNLAATSDRIAACKALSGSAADREGIAGVLEGIIGSEYEADKAKIEAAKLMGKILEESAGKAKEAFPAKSKEELMGEYCGRA